MSRNAEQIVASASGRHVLPHLVANCSTMDTITVRDAPVSYSALMRKPPIPTCTHQRNSSDCTGIWLELGSSSVAELFLCSTFISSENCSALTWLAITTRSVCRLTSSIVTIGASLLVSADLDPSNRASLVSRTIGAKRAPISYPAAAPALYRLGRSTVLSIVPSAGVALLTVASRDSTLFLIPTGCF